jgi:hypothetical protein
MSLLPRVSGIIIVFCFAIVSCNEPERLAINQINVKRFDSSQGGKLDELKRSLLRQLPASHPTRVSFGRNLYADENNFSALDSSGEFQETFESKFKFSEKQKDVIVNLRIQHMDVYPQDSSVVFRVFKLSNDNDVAVVICASSEKGKRNHLKGPLIFEHGTHVYYKESIW